MPLLWWLVVGTLVLALERARVPGAVVAVPIEPEVVRTVRPGHPLARVVTQGPPREACRQAVVLLPALLLPALLAVLLLPVLLPVLAVLVLVPVATLQPLPGVEHVGTAAAAALRRLQRLPPLHLHLPRPRSAWGRA